LPNIEKFYDELAEYYRLIYPDWETSVLNQAKALDNVIQERFGPNAKKILDAACGIGTQAIGLAQLGYEVSASDISSSEIALAEQETSVRREDIHFRCVDMRQVDQAFTDKFDVVIACDNAIPHLLTDQEISSAFLAFHRSLKSGGGLIISVRDYEAMNLGGTQVHPRLVHEENNVRLVLCDVWDFDDNKYDITIYVIRDDGSDTIYTKAIRGGRYYCISISELVELLTAANFTNVEVLQDAFFQPLLVASKMQVYD
jgi:2-polyprenyl-3-methyl-5-hydroxy-6-metoxy-1,4-benzoquinol methylase